MVEVRLSAFDADLADLEIVAKEFERYFPSVAIYEATPGMELVPAHERSLHLRITRSQMSAPYRVSAERGVTLSLWQSTGICRYAGISRSTYLTLCGLLGISQWSALDSNPLLRPEDLLHPPKANCLFATPGDIESFALLLEDPWICPGCVDFYHCLGADREVVALLDALGKLRRTLNAN